MWQIFQLRLVSLHFCLMSSLANSLYTFWAVILLVIILVGSPLSGFGCQTIVPGHVASSCETNWGGTAVQTNHIQPATPTLAIFIIFGIIFWLIPPQQRYPELCLRPPSPPPRSFV